MQFYPSGTRIAGRYEVAGRPLMGGMGIVYLCFDHEAQHPVALKTFKPQYLSNGDARERFLKEADTWVQLGKQPHIVRCYQVFQDSPRPDVYLVLELVAKEEGREDASLRAWLTPGRPLSADKALLIALQIARGMDHAAAAIPGFVHRDLKPENVLVGADRLSNAAINRVRITDFGLVRGLRSEEMTGALSASETPTKPGHLTQMGILLGTAEYMAPEQWDGPNVGAQADIYAFGCILGEMVTGCMLVRGEPRRGLGEVHKGGAALAAVQNASVPLRELLGFCLTTDPAKRYADWPTVEAALATAYHAATGQAAPKAEAVATLNRAERVAAGWSYDEIGGSYLELGQAEQAVHYFTAAQAAGRAEGERSLVRSGLVHLGSACRQRGDARRAISYYEQALTNSREIGDLRSTDRHGESVILGNLGNAYLQLGDAQRAISYHEQALAIDREIGDRPNERLHLANLGSDYDDMGNARRAIDYHEQALAIDREMGDRRGEGKALSGLGRAYFQLADTQRAGHYYDQALAIKRALGDRHGEATVLGNLGAIYVAMGESRRAHGYLEQALAIRREIGDLDGVVATCFNMAVLYVRQGNPAQALPLAREAAYLSSQIGQTARAQQAQQLVAQLERQGH